MRLEKLFLVTINSRYSDLIFTVTVYFSSLPGRNYLKSKPEIGVKWAIFA